jgi:hypothetical protein
VPANRHAIPGVGGPGCPPPGGSVRFRGTLD